MRKFVVAATLVTITSLPIAARAGFLVDTSVGQGYQAAPTPRRWEPLNLELAPGWAPPWPGLSMFRVQLGVVLDLATTSGSSTNLGLRPMLSLVPPVFPLYGRLIFAVDNLVERNGSKRELAYGGALGLKVGLPGESFVPSMGVFVEVAALPRKRDLRTDSPDPFSTSSKLAWVVEGRAGAYLTF